MSQKSENLLNLALEATEEERTKSLELEVGYYPCLLYTSYSRNSRSSVDSLDSVERRPDLGGPVLRKRYFPD